MARTDDKFREAYNGLLGICHTLGVGSELPSESQLAADLAVSRTVVRAALSRLNEQCIVRWEGRRKHVLRKPKKTDRFELPQNQLPESELETQIFNWILRSDMPVGASLNITAMSREFDVPAHHLQRLLTGLGRTGLVDRGDRGGWILRGFTESFAIELAEFRRVIELNAVTVFVGMDAQHPVWQRLDAVEQEHRDLLTRIDTDYQAFSSLDEEFHRVLNSVVNNRFITDAQNAISLIFYYHYNWDKTDERERNENAIHEHLHIIKSIRMRDGAAATKALRAHLDTARKTLIASMRKHHHI